MMKTYEFTMKDHNGHIVSLGRYIGPNAFEAFENGVECGEINMPKQQHISVVATNPSTGLAIGFIAGNYKPDLKH